ncbi:hypothetical protein [Legionella spiritensis]|uniref:hypothetical protein n=1 Tax=Legionella spiritensis TaxID=452 RepID=UPI000F82174E|nr:hypothetical protein [Legionella spiritensis]
MKENQSFFIFPVENQEKFQEWAANDQKRLNNLKSNNLSKLLKKSKLIGDYLTALIGNSSIPNDPACLKRGDDRAMRKLLDKNPSVAKAILAFDNSTVLTHWNIKKLLLKKIGNQFIDEIDFLARSATFSRNSACGFFISNDDVGNTEYKHRLLNYLFDNVLKKASEQCHEEKIILWGKKPVVQKKEFSALVDKLNESQRDIVLEALYHALKPIVDTENKSGKIQNYDERRSSPADKKGLLKIHSLNDQFFFGWLAKLMVMIESTLGLKTRSEKLVEDTVDDIACYGTSLKP